jgi:hypothetical protein
MKWERSAYGQANNVGEHVSIQEPETKDQDHCGFSLLVQLHAPDQWNW